MTSPATSPPDDADRKPPPEPGFRRFTYSRMHIPSGRVDHPSIDLPLDTPGDYDFLRRINRWNCNQPGVWAYWWE